MISVQVLIHKPTIQPGFPSWRDVQTLTWTSSLPIVIDNLVLGQAGAFNLPFMSLVLMQQLKTVLPVQVM